MSITCIQDRLIFGKIANHALNLGAYIFSILEQQDLVYILHKIIQPVKYVHHLKDFNIFRFPTFPTEQTSS